ncbi:cation:proton antiporter [Pontibacter sp. E15-1]|uniref:MnhB domain-containing protein n=1 Tax=Pontibacter sp. E15-1 TaxID=2919918 RepID=UPI001F4FA25F|nr:MnhB domain-containing protein [Pontibacter sp. E15-1]MCJ8163653.1 cation:proton antiporter [Pontibacter sp. E15-1]
MKTIIFSTAIRLLTPVFLLFSVYILFRGHNHPGGGFIGGLICSIAFVFHVLAHGPGVTSRVFFSVVLYYYSRPKSHSYTRYALRVLRANFRNKRDTDEPHKWSFVFLRIRPLYLVATGLLLAASSGIVSLLGQKPFMTSYWLKFELPVIGSIGTPSLFDLGVYLLVLGVVLQFIFIMSKE